MIRLFYSLIIQLLLGAARLAAFFNSRLSDFINSRDNLKTDLIQFNPGQQKVIWIHCASLGEFEQGRPVIEQLRLSFPHYRLLLTFFSPSGYEIRKNYPLVDKVTYIPFDTPRHTREFVTLVNPAFVLLVKYEFWPNLLHALAQKKVPVISISSIFRSNQIFFRSYGSMYLKALQGIGHFFVQNQQSKDLLNKYGINQVSVSGDTRFDRVREIINSTKQPPDVENFLDNKPCWVIGSAWAEDLAVLNPLFLKYQNTFKFIFAPHHVDSDTIQHFEKHISIPSTKYSDLQHSDSASALLIIDQIGLLSGLYSFATFAWVGGAFGKGLHNILEAAAYGVPIFFGDKNFNKFQEAVDLIQLNAAFSCSDFPTLDSILDNFSNNPNDLTAAKAAASQYVSEHTGATAMIMNYLKTEFHS